MASGGRGSIEMAKLEIGKFLFEPALAQLSIDGKSVRLEPKVAAVLVALAARPYEPVSRSELIDDVWGVEFGGDESLSRAISVLRRTFREGDSGTVYIETIPRKGYRLVVDAVDVSAVGGPPKQTKPQLIRDPQTVEPASEDTIQSISWRLYAVSFAILGIALVVSWVLASDSTGSRLSSSVFASPTEAQFGPVNRFAISSFDVPADDDRLVRFERGLQESYAAVFRTLQADADDDVPAGILLTGRVDSSGTHLVIDHRLVHVESGVILWSERLDRETASPHFFQDEAARRIHQMVLCVQIKMRREPREMKIGSAQLMLKLCEAVIDSDLGSLVNRQRAEEYAASEPDRVDPYAFVAITNFRANLNSPNSDETKSTFAERAKEAAERAMTIDPEDAQSLYAKGLSELIGSVSRTHLGANSASAEKYLKLSATAEIPHLSAMADYADMILWPSGRLSEASEMYEKAQIGSPFNQFLILGSANLAFQRRDFLRYREYMDASLVTFEDTYQAEQADLVNTAFTGDPDEALARIDGFRDREVFPGQLDCLQFIVKWRDQGGSLSFEDIDRSCLPIYRSFVYPFSTDTDAVFDWLQSNDPPLFSLANLWSPRFREVRADPRFIEIANRKGLVRYWLETDQWPDFCVTENIKYDCREQSIQVTTGMP